MPKFHKYFKDYLEFRTILLGNNIKNQSEFATFLGLGDAAISQRFSQKQEWRLKELIFMAKKFGKPIDELCKMLDIA